MEEKKGLKKEIEKKDADFRHGLFEQDNSSFLNLVNQIKPINPKKSTKNNNTEEK